VPVHVRNGGQNPPLRELVWEVLPPEEKQRRSQLEPIFRWVALIMDELLRVPGTRFRFGLDPLIGLVPGLGDTASAFVSALTLIQAARLGLPKLLLARMSLNILLNELIGIIPGVGDAFSFWFKSNTRNYNLLQRHINAPQRSRKSDWMFVAAVLGLLFVIVCAGLLATVLIFNELLKLLSRT
jgi:Domain of unknown function (DUF4112)